MPVANPVDPSSNGTDSLIRAEGLAKSYGDNPVLTDVTCEIRPGVTGLLGANGAGKTTLLGMILGLHEPTSGSLTVFGQEPYKAGAEIRERIGYGPEHHRLPPNLRASDFVRHIGEIHGLPRAEATTRASDALWLVDLGEERFRPLGTMSTGQRQRVKLAQAIVHDPRLILIDEPTDGLDPTQREVMLALIQSVASDFGISVLISSHLIEEVERVCDQAVVLGDGRVIASGRIDELGDGTGTQLLIELDTDPAAVVALGANLQQLLSPPVTVGSDARNLVVTGADEVAQTLVINYLADNSVGIVRLYQRGRSLEDVMLEALA